VAGAGVAVGVTDGEFEGATAVGATAPSPVDVFSADEGVAAADEVAVSLAEPHAPSNNAPAARKLARNNARTG